MNVKNKQNKPTVHFFNCEKVQFEVYMKVQVHSQSSVLICLGALKINNIVYVEITKNIYA